MRFFIAICLLVSIDASAQWKSFIISVRGDTLNRVDQKDRKQGPWVESTKALRGNEAQDEQGFYVDNMREGRWVKFSQQGDKLAEENYRWGVLDGVSKYYTRTGGLERQEIWRAVEPGKNFDTVAVTDINDPGKELSRVVVKIETKTIQHGTWTYYDPQMGTIVKTENWFMGKLRTGNGLPGEDDEIAPIAISGSDSLGKKKTTKPQAILDYEKKNSGKKKVRTRDGSTGF